MVKLEKLISKNSGIMLDLGCGKAKRNGWIGMDKRKLKGVDIVHDVEDTPWPLPSDCCNTILCSHLLEHIDPRRIMDVMAEIHRVGKQFCQVQVSTPYAGSRGAYQDPTHTRPGFNEVTFIYFDPRPVNGMPNNLYKIYTPPPLFIERLEWSVNGNMEVLLRVIKDKALIRKAMKDVKRKISITGAQ